MQVPGHPRHPPEHLAGRPAADPSRHGADRVGADGQLDQGGRRGVPGTGRGPHRRASRSSPTTGPTCTAGSRSSRTSSRDDRDLRPHAEAACLVRARLERDPRWREYTGRLDRFAIQQTELARLTPPSPRTKARFMNLEGAVSWGSRTLALVDEPSSVARLGISAERFETKLGWLVEFREALEEWSSYHEMIGGTSELVRPRGRGGGGGAGGSLPVGVGRACQRADLIEFVRSESSKAGPARSYRGRRRCWSRASGS